MAISVLLRALTRRGQISTSFSSYESVFRNVNTPIIPWAGFVLDKSLSLGSRAFCSKPDHNDLAAQNETKRLSVSNPTNVVFKYVCSGDKPQDDTNCFKIRRIVETPAGCALFELTKEGDVYYPVNNVFAHILKAYVVVAEAYSGRRVSTVCIAVPSFFIHNISSLLTKVAVVGLNIDSVLADVITDEADEKTEEETEDSIPSGINSGSRNTTIFDVVYDFVVKRVWAMIKSGDKMVVDSGTGHIKLTLNLDDVFEIRTWEIMTNGEKPVLEIIVGELQRHGFDFTEDPLAHQKLEQAVERAIARSSNTIKLNLPVPAGHPEMSTTVSWGTSDYGYRSCSPSDGWNAPCPQ